MSEWTTCLVQVPVACGVIADLTEDVNAIETGDRNWRRDLDGIRQHVDKVSGDCVAFSNVHGRHRRSAKLEELPCQKLRRRIMVDEMGGAWMEHDYTIPAGRRHR